jgi:hypothetical protein
MTFTQGFTEKMNRVSRIKNTIGVSKRKCRAILLAITGLLQCIRKKCDSDSIHGMIFFDEGHNEYIRFFRRASKYLPTGSRFGGWRGGKATINRPLNMFLKDANIKASQFSLFVQIADFTCHAALQKLRYEKNLLPAERIAHGHQNLYDAIPGATLNDLSQERRDSADMIMPRVGGRKKCASALQWSSQRSQPATHESNLMTRCNVFDADTRYRTIHRLRLSALLKITPPEKSAACGFGFGRMRHFAFTDQVFDRLLTVGN